MTGTDAATLDKLRTARDRIIEGGVQSYTLNGQTFTMLNLDALEALIERYETRVNNHSAGRYRVAGAGGSAL